jgi:hypothetical protein
MDFPDKTGTSRPRSGGVKLLSHALRLGLQWGLTGLLLGMFIGAAAGLWYAMIVNVLYGIGGDHASGPISLTTEQTVWVYIRGLGLGITFVGGLFAIVCSLMGCFWGIIEARSAVRKRSNPDDIRDDNERRP